MLLRLISQYYINKGKSTKLTKVPKQVRGFATTCY